MEERVGMIVSLKEGRVEVKHCVFVGLSMKREITLFAKWSLLHSDTWSNIT